MAENPSARALAISPYQLALDYQIYKSAPADGLFGPQETSILESIRSNPPAGKLVDDYWSKLPENQGMDRVGPATGNFISLDDWARQVYRDFGVAPSLLANNPLSGWFGYMAQSCGYDHDHVLKAMDMGQTLWEPLHGMHGMAEAAESKYRWQPENLHSPHEKPEPPVYDKRPLPLEELQVPGLAPGPSHEQQFRVRPPENEAKSEPDAGREGVSDQGKPAQTEQAQPRPDEPSLPQSDGPEPNFQPDGGPNVSPMPVYTPASDAGASWTNAPNGSPDNGTSPYDPGQPDPHLASFDPGPHAASFGPGELDPHAASFDSNQPDPHTASLGSGQPDPHFASFDPGQPDPHFASFDPGQPDPHFASFDPGQPDPHFVSFDSSQSGPTQPGDPAGDLSTSPDPGISYPPDLHGGAGDLTGTGGGGDLGSAGDGGAG